MTDENQPTSPIDPLTIGKLISLNEAAEKTGLSTSYLRAIARKGRLKAEKVGRDWLTTLAAVAEYKRTRSHTLKDE
ncbi:MAG: helix-turn-helix domain-containing protein [Chloroflexi bacterium]|nr:helix-turn-helix domain-containing protein [Chloroflexota bacterium]